MVKKLIQYSKNALFNSKYRLLAKNIDSKHQKQLSDIKKLYTESGRIHAYFIMNSLQAWKIDSLYWAMDADDCFEPLIVVVPSPVDSGEGTVGLYQHFESKGYKVIKGFNDKRQPIDIASDMQPGIFFYSDPYGNMATNHFDELIEKNIACYVPYFFMATNHAGGITLIPNSVPLNNMWRIYMPHDAVSAIFSKRSARKGRNAKVVGYPAVETLYNQKCSSRAWKTTTGKKKIIYAPHHSIGWGKRSLATFLQFGEVFQKLAEKHAGKVQWSFKPHPMLKARLYEHVNWDREKTDAYYEFWNNQDYTQLDEGEYDDLFLSSDAIIHDCSSFIVEYAFTKKPCLYLVNENNLKGLLNAFGEGVMQVYEQARTVTEIEGFIDGIVNETIQVDESKRAYFDAYVDEYYKGKLPSERIIDDIKQSLGVLSDQ